MVAVFNKVDKFSFIILQMFGYSGNKKSLQKGLFSLRCPFLQGLVKMLHT